MHLRPATPQDAQAAADLVIAGDIAEIGEADYSLGDLHDEWRGARPRQGHAGRRGRRRRDRRLRPLPRQRRARPGRPAPRGRGLRDRAAEPGPSGARANAARRSVRQGVGDRGASRPRAAEAHGYAPARSFWRMERDLRSHEETADETGLRPSAPDDAPALHAITDRAFAGDGGYELESRGGVDAARVQRATARPRALARHRRAGQSASRSSARWEQDTLYVAAARRPPRPPGQGLGGRLLQRRLRRRRSGRTASTLNVASDNPNAVKLYERVGMTQALAGRRLPEGAARLGRQWAPSRSTLPTTSAARRWSSSRRLAPEGGGDGLRQARDVQPRRVGQGPDRRGDDRGGRDRRAGSSPAARRSSRPPAATPASRSRSCAPPRATS